MATEDQLKTIGELLAQVVQTPIDSLVRNQDWGKIDFEKARPALKLAFDLAGHLQQLPLEILPDATANDFSTRIENVRTSVEQIRIFSIETTDNPMHQRDQIVSTVQANAEQLLIGTQGWIGFLAYQKGDVQRSIAALAKSVADAKEIVDKSKVDVASKAGEITEIIRTAREASAGAGVGVFTSDFLAQAGVSETEAEKWLSWTVKLAVLTVVAAIGSYFVPIEKDASSAQVVQYVSSKIVTILLLLTATVWCGRLYKASKHQATVNYHRANALKTFQAFVKAASGDQTRDAVLLETTRSIFAIAPSGYLDTSDSASDPGTKVFEVIKNTTSNVNPGK